MSTTLHVYTLGLTSWNQEARHLNPFDINLNLMYSIPSTNKKKGKTNVLDDKTSNFKQAYARHIFTTKVFQNKEQNLLFILRAILFICYIDC